MKDFDDIESGDTTTHKNLLVVDGLNLAFRYKHAKTKNYAMQFMETVNSLANSYECSNIIVLGDGGSAFRKNLFPAYKANREDLKKAQTEEEGKEFADFLAEFDKALELCSLRFLTIKRKGVEADDIAAYIVKYFTDPKTHIWLISTDRDWDLLISEHVSRFSYVTRKEITFENWSTHYEYDIDQHISIKVLAGDKGDNVPGIEGVGPKRAHTLLRQYETAFDIYDNLPIPGKQKFIQNVNTFGDQFLVNYQLMDLLTYCEEALLEHEYEIKDLIGEYLCI